jgi:Na+:H+ antiporter, NhaA family
MRWSANRYIQAAVRLLTAEPAAGLVLIAAAAAAIVWANVSPSTYGGVWQAPMSIGIRPLVLTKPVELWVNDGLMAVFFFAVGLEIKRELVRGELASLRQAALPVAAAVGGMVVPASLYAALNFGDAGQRGWGVPVATDIAFALAVLALVSKRLAPSLRSFLAAVAIADDVGAIAVIAIFYTDHLQWLAFVIGAAILVVLVVMNRIGIESGTPYVVLGIALWLAVLKTGVHATIAGVLLAFIVPATPGGPSDHNAASLLDRFEHALRVWVGFAIMPVFALANAGVQISGTVVLRLAEPVAVGIVLGLFLGKQLGVMASCWALVRFGFAMLPSGMTWPQLYGVALLCGIGFTMSLFIATLAFDGSSQLESAKVGVLAGSLLSALAGSIALRRCRSGTK